jgi:exopolysaccharide biosynthesis protein
MNALKRRIIIFIIVFILGLASYLAADRYLIRHVEIDNVSAYAETTTNGSSTVVSATTVPSITTSSPAVSSSPTQVSATKTVTADAWNYVSDTVSIKVTKYTTGSGQNTLTYFVADVVVSDATRLKSAFADNQFGRNIIAYTSQIAKANNAIFAINGDYYGFRSDGIEIRNGVIFQDKPARIGLAFYRDGTMKVYDETKTNAQELLKSGVWNTLSFGPALIENSVVATNLTKVEIDTNFGNHSIQGNEPRTGVGIIAPNHFIFIVVDGRSSGYSRGASLTEFSDMFKKLGCTDAYNIDGGGSSTMYFMNRVVNNPLGKNQERGTSDILLIQ